MALAQVGQISIRFGQADFWRHLPKGAVPKKKVFRPLFEFPLIGQHETLQVGISYQDTIED